MIGMKFSSPSPLPTRVIINMKNTDSTISSNSSTESPDDLPTLKSIDA